MEPPHLLEPSSGLNLEMSPIEILTFMVASSCFFYFFPRIFTTHLFIEAVICNAKKVQCLHGFRFSNVFSGPSMSHTGPWVILLGAHFFEFVGMGPKSPGEKNNQSISGCQAQQTVII